MTTEVNLSFANAPQAITITSPSGETVGCFFLKNNPWKVSQRDRCQKIYRFCVICGENRYPGDLWDSIRPRLRENPVVSCTKPSCLKACARLGDALSTVPFRIALNE